MEIGGLPLLPVQTDTGDESSRLLTPMQRDGVAEMLGEEGRAPTNFLSIPRVAGVLAALVITGAGAMHWSQGSGLIQSNNRPSLPILPQSSTAAPSQDLQIDITELINGMGTRGEEDYTNRCEAVLTENPQLAAAVASTFASEYEKMSGSLEAQTRLVKSYEKILKHFENKESGREVANMLWKEGFEKIIEKNLREEKSRPEVYQLLVAVSEDRAYLIEKSLFEISGDLRPEVFEFLITEANNVYEPAIYRWNNVVHMEAKAKKERETLNGVQVSDDNPSKEMRVEFNKSRAEFEAAGSLYRKVLRVLNIIIINRHDANIASGISHDEELGTMISKRNAVKKKIAECEYDFDAYVETHPGYGDPRMTWNGAGFDLVNSTEIG